MLNNHESVKETLCDIIADMSKTSMLYAKNPKKDFSRTRKLPFDTMLMMLVSMGGNTLSKELMDGQGYDPRVATSSAFVQQRDKILPLAFEFLLQQFTSSCANVKYFNGYRLLAVDGSSLNISHNPNDSDTYYRNAPHVKGFNQMHLNALYDLCSKIYVDAIVRPEKKKGECKSLVDMVDRSTIKDKVIIVGDRGFEAYNNLAHIERKGWHYVIRVKDASASNSILSSVALPKDDEFDVSVSFVLTRKQTNEVKARPDIYKNIPSHGLFDFLDLHDNKFYPLSFRAVRVILPNGEYETLITNLDANAFPPDVVREIYKLRWGIETSFRTLKYTIGLSNFHAKKREFIVQEIFARLILFNFVQIVSSFVVITQSDTTYEYKVNFTNAVHVCRRFLRLRPHEPPFDVLALIGKSLVPARPIRKSQSSARKTRPKTDFSFTYRIS